MKKDAALKPHELKKTLKYWIIAYSVGITFILATTGAPLTGFIRLLTKNDLIYSLIMAIPTLGAAFQIAGSFFIEKTGKRWESFALGLFLQRIVWIPISLIALFYFSINPNAVIIIVTLLIIVYSVSGHIANISFNSCYVEIVPKDIAGRYYSKRISIVTAVGAVGSILVGKYLGDSPTLYNFAIMFCVVSILGILDAYLSSFVAHYPPMIINKDKVSFTKLIFLPFKDRNYLYFIVFGTVWAFGVNISAVFINVYLLEDLKIDYLTISIIVALLFNLCSIISMRLWGRLADSFGNKPVLRVCSSIAIIIPLLWLLPSSANKFIFIIPTFIISGIAWSGTELATINLSMWLSPEKNRTIYIAIYALTSSVLGIALSSIIGGLIMQLSGPTLESLKIPFINGQYFNKFHLIFIISFLVRLFASLILIRNVKEESSTSSKELLRYIIDVITLKSLRSNIKR